MSELKNNSAVYIESLELGYRLESILKLEGINTSGDLRDFIDNKINGIPGIGKLSIKKIERRLKELGLMSDAKKDTDEVNVGWFEKRERLKHKEIYKKELIQLLSYMKSNKPLSIDGYVTMIYSGIELCSLVKREEKPYPMSKEKVISILGAAKELTSKLKYSKHHISDRVVEMIVLLENKSEPGEGGHRLGIVSRHLRKLECETQKGKTDKNWVALEEALKILKIMVEDWQGSLITLESVMSKIKKTLIKYSIMHYFIRYEEPLFEHKIVNEEHLASLKIQYSDIHGNKIEPAIVNKTIGGKITQRNNECSEVDFIDLFIMRKHENMLETKLFFEKERNNGVMLDKEDLIRQLARDEEVTELLTIGEYQCGSF